MGPLELRAGAPPCSGAGTGASRARSPAAHRSLSPQLLYEEWASYGVFYKYQPIDLVR